MGFPFLCQLPCYRRERRKGRRTFAKVAHFSFQRFFFVLERLLVEGY